MNTYFFKIVQAPVVELLVFFCAEKAVLNIQFKGGFAAIWETMAFSFAYDDDIPVTRLSAG